MAITLQHKIAEGLGTLEGYDFIPLANPRYSDNSYHSSYLQPASAIDGRLTYDAEFYSAENGWNPTIYGAASSPTIPGLSFSVELQHYGRVDKVKTYPRQYCCYDRHEYFEVYAIDLTGNHWRCTTTDDVSAANIPNLFFTGVTWDCPVDQGPSQYDITQIKITTGSANQYIQITEIEAFGTAPLTTLYQPDNLMLRNYAPDLLHRFVNQSNIITNVDETVEKVLSHGCWCAKLDKSNPYLEFLGGPDAVDELDELCRNWFKCRNCNEMLRGGSCNVENSSSKELLKARSYELKSDLESSFIDTVTCNIENDACADDSCSIDLLYMKDIFNYLEDNHQGFSNLVVTDNSTCSAAVNTNKPRICTGTAPYLTPVINDAEKYISEGWERPWEGNGCNPGSPEHMGTDVVYKFFDSYADPNLGSNWYAAKDHCQSLGDGVTLARIFCFKEQFYLWTVTRQRIGGSTAWLGGNDINNEGYWVWAESDGSDGIAIESTGGWNIEWNSGQPDNAGGVEDCMEINRFTNDNMNDLPCTAEPRGFWCEKRFFH